MAFTKPVFMGYVGAYPNGLSPPKQYEVPPIYNMLCLAFARDCNLDGNFVAHWDTNNITTEWIAYTKVANPNNRYLISVGGDVLNWNQNPNSNWVNNAVKSLNQLKTKWNCDGFDFNYENISSGCETSFIKLIGELISKLKPSIITVSPFSTSQGPGTMGLYSKLYSSVGKDIDMIFYQVYAETSGDTNGSQHWGIYKKVVDAFGGDKDKVALGICSAVNKPASPPYTASNARGTQDPLAIFAELQSDGINHIFMWTLEDSLRGRNPTWQFENSLRPLWEISSLSVFKVVLAAHWRTLPELYTMTAGDMRNCIIVELNKSMDQDIAWFSDKSDAELAAYGAMVMLLRDMGRRTVAEMKKYDAGHIKNTVIVELNNRQGTPVQTLQGYSNQELALNFWKLGALSEIILTAKWRSSSELCAMSEGDKCNCIVVELNKAINETVSHLQAQTTETLVALGNMILLMKAVGIRTPSELKNMNAGDIRNCYVVELKNRAKITIDVLGRFSNQELVVLLKNYT